MVSAGRPGHSLPELIVALSILGTALAGVASAAVLGSRWTTDAVRLQRGLGVAEQALDSLARSRTAPSPGEVHLPEWGVSARWDVAQGEAGGGAVSVVTVRVLAADRVVVELDGVWTPPLTGPLP